MAKTSSRHFVRILIERWFSMRSVVTEEQRAPLVSDVPGAEALRDALVFLRLELEALGVAKPNLFNRSLGRTVPAGPALREERELEDASTWERLRDVSEAVAELDADTRTSLLERGVDLEFLGGLAQGKLPVTDGDRGVVHPQIVRALEAFTRYDYDQAQS